MSKVLRSFLFVPATRPERINKALASGADGVIVDLEDAVEETAKGQARTNLVEYFAENPSAQIFLRINSIQDTANHQADLALCGYPQVIGIFLPKAEQAETINALFKQINKPLLLIIETALGVDQVSQLAQADGVQQLSFGALDLALDLGFRTGTEAAQQLCDQVRGLLLVASRLAGIAAPIDAVYPRIADSDGLLQQARYAADMGMGGMLCIHPKQINPVHQAFSPDAEEIQWAEEVLALYAEHEQGVFMLNGEMIDAPVIAKARGIVAYAK
ncbi:HpcH/HpaI aldolase/citrate lyase family protein [Denitrificimonas caeni]|uniref:HpcH/HpaI aldolase/citrate lyase family protein n=1 Tax=Denitrificimonas caeni TaxID=521720 RepID=UPI001965C1A8|nr:CoA ester lyase [Denitrificimonas caeni]